MDMAIPEDVTIWLTRMNMIEDLRIGLNERIRDDDEWPSEKIDQLCDEVDRLIHYDGTRWTFVFHN